MAKNRMAFFFVAALIMNIVSGSYGYAQKTVPEINNRCKAELNEIFKSERRYAEQLIASGKSWYMDFTFKAKAKVYTDNEYTDVTTHGEVIASANYRYIKEDQYEIFLDENDVFTLNSNDKSIMRTQSSKVALAYGANPHLEIANDSMMKQYYFADCNEEYDSLLKLKLVCYTLVPYNKSKSNYEMMKISVDKEIKMLRKIQIWYNTAAIRDMKMSITIINKRGEKQANISLPVKNMFLAANGQLKSAYNKYKYKDLKK